MMATVKLKSMPGKVKTKKAKLRHGWAYCVAGGPSTYSFNNTNFVEGITMHKFPKDEELRKKWLKFVHTHRPNFEPKERSCLCSSHFEPSCFERKIDLEMKSPTRL